MINIFYYLHPHLCLATPCEESKRREKERKSMKDTLRRSTSLRIKCFLISQGKLLERGRPRKTLLHQRSHTLLFTQKARSHTHYSVHYNALFTES